METQNLNPKNQELHNSTPVSSNDPMNTNHRQIYLTGTNVIQLITQIFNISENLQENHKKIYFWYITEL